MMLSWTDSNGFPHVMRIPVNPAARGKPVQKSLRSLVRWVSVMVKDGIKPSAIKIDWLE